MHSILVLAVALQIQFVFVFSYVLTPGTPYSGDLTNFQYKIRLIFPGTKWCGDGDIASDYDDLGTLRETDMCCREHDHCTDLIPAGESKHGLKNNALFTLLSCDCDNTFHTCLAQTNCTSANLVGESYFNALRTQCYDYTYPATCSKYEKLLWIKLRCIEYEYDTNKTKEWQWFDKPAWKEGLRSDRC